MPAARSEADEPNEPLAMRLRVPPVGCVLIVPNVVDSKQWVRAGQASALSELKTIDPQSASDDGRQYDSQELDVNPSLLTLPTARIEGLFEGWRSRSGVPSFNTRYPGKDASNIVRLKAWLVQFSRARQKHVVAQQIWLLRYMDVWTGAEWKDWWTETRRC